MSERKRPSLSDAERLELIGLIESYDNDDVAADEAAEATFWRIVDWAWEKGLV